MPSKNRHTSDGPTTSIVRRTSLSNRSTAGDLIRSSRMAKGYNQPTLAKLLGISKSCITNWENGLTLPGSQVIPKLCSLLALDPAELFATPQPETRAHTQEERDCLNLFRRLGSRDQRTVLSLMTTLSDNAAQDGMEP